jgi:hypothetical protein
MRIEIPHKFNIGDEVGIKETEKIGKVSQIRTKLIKESDTVYKALVSYSVATNGKYNNFRASEENLKYVVYDVTTDKPHFIEEVC